MTDKQISTYCDDVKETALRQFYKIQNQRKEISLLHKKCTLQQAEIERLRENNKSIMQTIADVHTETIKEFIERLKESAFKTRMLYSSIVYELRKDDIDNLVKEMVGDDK